MNHPTDPMTPVRALIEAAGKATPGEWMPGEPYQTDDGTLELAVYAEHPFKPGEKVYPLVVCLQFPNAEKMQVANREFVIAAKNATASISQLLAEHDKVVEYIKELRDEGVCMPSNIYKTLPDERRGLLRCADRLQSIVEGK